MEGLHPQGHDLPRAPKRPSFARPVKGIGLYSSGRFDISERRRNAPAGDSYPAHRHQARCIQHARVWVVRARRGRPQSDLDLPISVGPKTTSWFPGGLVADLEQLLGPRVNVVIDRALSPLIRDRVLSKVVSQ